MDIAKWVEEKVVVSEEETVAQGGDAHTSTLVGMGQISKETHGFVHGLEFGYLPKS
jgi:hypothetical protein